MNHPFYLIVKRECQLACIKSGTILNPLAFFVMTVSLFPFALGESPLLIKLGGGIIWMAALLASMMSFPYVFEEDYEDGSLDQFMLSGVSPSLVVASKMMAHWGIASLPLIILSPLLAMMLGLNGEMIRLLILSLVLGTPSLTMIGVLGASLTLGLKKSGNILAVLVLPLMVPILIFGAVMVTTDGNMMHHTYVSAVILSALFFILLPVTITAATLAMTSKTIG